MKKQILLIAVLLIGFYCQAQKNTVNDKALNNRSDTIDILNYQINLDMTNMGAQMINGNCVITFTPKINGVTYIGLDLQELTVDSITSNGNLLTFTHNDT